MRACLLSLACAALLPLSASAETPLAVEILTAHVTTDSHDFTLTGTLAATDSYPASFRNGGRVIAVAVEVGELVAKGAVLARLDPTQAEAARRAAQAVLDGAEAALWQAGLAKERAEGLLARGTGTQADLDAATEAWTSARAGRDQAEAALEKARRAVEDCSLLAVEDAIVTARQVEPGQVVGAGQTALVLAGQTGREAVFLAPDGLQLEENLGRKVMLTPLDGPADLQLVAELTEVSPIVAANGTVRLKARLDDPAGGGLAIGAPLTGRVPVEGPARITLPWTALTASAAGPAVWTVDPATMTVSLTPVELSSYGNDSVALQSGLAEGAQVVAAGSHLLYPGRAVVAAVAP